MCSTSCGGELTVKGPIRYVTRTIDSTLVIAPPAPNSMTAPYMESRGHWKAPEEVESLKDLATQNQILQ